MRPHILAGAVLSLIPAASAHAQAARRDTIDVSVGSTLVDFSKHVPGSTLAHQQWSMGEDTRTSPVMRWNFSYADTGGTPLLLVHPTAADPSTPTPPLPVYVFNRKTLALLRVLDPKTSATQLTIDATKVSGHVPGPNGPVPIDVTLSEPAYFRPLADLITESLPRRVGAVYRVPLWGPPSPAVETHLYSFVRREDVTVLGKTYHNAWVVEDRAADGTRLNGTMWLVDGAPELVRWIINLPNGGVIQLDQEPAQG
jgi:hypothetical protein